MDPMFAAAGGLRDAYDGVDWAATTLGPVPSWGPALRSAVDLALRTRFAVTLLWGPQHVLVYNEAFVPMIADKHPHALGSPAREAFAEIWDDIGPMLKQVSSGGGAIWVEDLRLDLRRHGFLEECYFTFSYSPVVGADGRIEGVIDIASETTPQILAHRRLDLLNRLNDHLAGVDHHSQVIERALPLLRDDPSDLPDVDIRPSGGELAGGELAGGDVSIRDTPAGKVAAIRLSTVAGALGDLTLTTTLSSRLVPDEAYLGFIRLVAGTLTQALDRTRLREAEQRVNAIEREISETIQRSLLTPPPRTRDFEIAVRYQPAAELAQIGGDWYDSFLLGDGTLTVVVGDISGHDRHAAAAMAQVRNMLRGVTHTLQGPPSRILTAIDDAMFGLDINTFATVILAQIEREQQPGAPLRHILRWSNAGHPAPILLGPDGTAQLLRRPSQLLLGTGIATTRSDETVSVAPGSHVIFYTDGLIERRGEPIDQSQNALVEALSGLYHLSAEQLCDVLLASRPWTAAIDDIVVTVVHTGAGVD